MPASGAVAAFGTTFGIGDGASPEVFTTLAEVVSISGLKPTQNTADVTNMGSTGGYMEHVTTTRDPGTIDLELNFIADNANQLAMYQTKFNAGTIQNYQITYTDTGTSTCTFAASVESYNINSTTDGKAEMSMTLKVDGQPTWA